MYINNIYIYIYIYSLSSGIKDSCPYYNTRTDVRIRTPTEHIE